MSFAMIDNNDRPVHAFFDTWRNAAKDEHGRHLFSGRGLDPQVMKDFVDTVNTPLRGNKRSRRKIFDKKRNAWIRFGCWMANGKVRAVNIGTVPEGQDFERDYFNVWTDPRKT